MSKDNISMRQLLVLLFTAMLSPAILTLPAQSVDLAGRAGWLSAVPAIPVLLALCWMLFTMFQKLPEGTGLASLFETVLGRVAGKLLTILYLVWGLLLLSSNTKQFAFRVLSTSYRNAPLTLFVVVLLAAALWVGRGRLSSFARAGEIFYLALSIALTLTLIFALLRIEAKNILPLWVEDAPDIILASVPVLAVLGYSIFAAFLAGGITPQKQDRTRAMKWAVTFCLLLTLLQLTCLGSFGPSLTKRMDSPFFMMVKGIGVHGAFERVESILVALWVLSDLALLCLLVFACKTMTQAIFCIPNGKNTVLPIILLSLLGASTFWQDTFALSAFMEGIVTCGNILFGFAIPGAVFLVFCLRSKKLST